jgi:hypothetical protein
MCVCVYTYIYTHYILYRLPQISSRCMLLLRKAEEEEEEEEEEEVMRVLCKV